MCQVADIQSEQPAGRVQRDADLLSPEPEIESFRARIGSQRVDIDAAATLVARIDCQFFTGTTPREVEKHTFDARFVEIVVLAK